SQWQGVLVRDARACRQRHVPESRPGHRVGSSGSGQLKAKPLADRWVALELGALYGFLYLAYGAHLPYWPSWLVSRGLSPGTASAVLAFGFLLRLVVAPVSAAWAGRHGDVRPSLRLLLAISAGGFVVVALAGGGTITATILSLATMLLLIPLTPLLDGL